MTGFFCAIQTSVIPCGSPWFKPAVSRRIGYLTYFSIPRRACQGRAKLRFERIVAGLFRLTNADGICYTKVTFRQVHTKERNMPS